MDLLQFQQGIKELVANDKLNEALSLIIQFSQAEDGYDDLENSSIINSGKLDRIEREKRDDRINPDDYAVQRSQVSAAILQLVAGLKPPAAPIVIPSSNTTSTNESNASANSDVSQQQIQNMMINHDKIFLKIILGCLVLSIGLFVFYMIQGAYPLGGAFFSSGAGTCFIYLNSQKRMLQSIQASV